MGVYYKKDIAVADLPTVDESIALTVEMNYLQANEIAKDREEVPPPQVRRVVTNADIGKYVDLGVDIVKTSETTDDWQVLYVDDTTNTTYLWLSDYIPASFMKPATGITINTTSGAVYSNTDVNALGNYLKGMNTTIEVEGATVTCAPTEEILEKSYKIVTGGSSMPVFPKYITNTRAKSLYILPNTENISGYWLGSVYNDEYVWYVSSISRVDYNGYINYDDLAGRAVVSLPSNTSLIVVE